MAGLWITPGRYVEFGEDPVNRKSLAREIASRGAAWDFTELVGMLPDPDPILTKRGDGAEILDSLTSDGHVLSVIQTRKIGTMKREWRLDPGKENDKPTPASEKLCSLLRADLEKISMSDLISALLDAPYLGMTPVELLWEPGEGGIRLQNLRPLPHRWFGFGPDNRPRFKSLAEPADGEELPWGKFVFARHFPTYDNPYGLRLLSRCFWPVMFKKGGIKFWVTFVEKYGMPFLLGKYRQGAKKEEQDTMLAALKKMVQDAVAVVPDGNTVEMLGGKASGSYLAFEKLKDAMDKEVSKVIMGQTLTADIGDNGSYAAGKVHEDVLEDYRESDQALVKTAMDEIGLIYSQVNAPGVPAPKFIWFESENPQKDFADRDKTITESGQVRLTKSYYKRRYGFQDDDIEIIDPAATATQRPGKQSFSEPAGFTPEQQAVEGLVDHSLVKVDLTAVEQAIIKTVQTASSYEEAMEKLLEIYPEMDMSSLQEMAEQSMLAADLYGRKVVQDGH